MPDQADKLRQMARAREPAPVAATPALPPVLTVTSGKGGVGKSVVTANVALCFAAAGQRVLLIDADSSLANLDIMFDCRSRLRLHHALSGQAPLSQCRNECAPNIALVSAGTGIGLLAGMRGEQRLRALLQLSAWEQQADIIIVDTGAGTSRMVIAAALAADNVLAVTTPEPTALTDVYAVIKLLRGSGRAPHIDLLVNMAADYEEAAGAAQRVSQVSARFLGRAVPWIGYVPFDAAVPRAVRAKVPLLRASGRGQAVKAFEDVVRALRARAQLLLCRQEGFFSTAARLLTAPPNAEPAVAAGLVLAGEERRSVL